MESEKIFHINNVTVSHPSQPDLQFHMCGTTYPNKSYAINRSLSRICCIEFIVSGTGHVTVDGQTLSPVAGDTYFLKAGIPHAYRSDKKDPWEKIWINVSGEMIDRLIDLYRLNGVYYYPKLDISDLLLKFQYYASHPNTERISEKFTSLLTAIFFRMSESLYAKKQPSQSPVQRMLDYIDLHETDVIRLEQLADACKKSTSQAERLFRAALGIPPYRYVLNRKIELAKQLLTETGMSVRDVSSYLSFEDEFYFSGLFRRKTGVSPTQYRKQLSAQKKE